MTDGVRRLTHEDAEMLISARMDEQLDRADSRALLVHLQTCESCRAFAVQSEVLGRELSALPVLPPSAIVDRQIRETIAKGNRRWSLAALLPGTAGNSGLRVALGALAVLTLVSVFLLVRMATDGTGDGGSIDAPSGGVAQQLDTTPTADLAMVQDTSAAGPTETPRVVVPKTQEPTSIGAAAPTQTNSASNQQAVEVQPTQTLDSEFLYPIDKSTKTPVTGEEAPTRTPESPPPSATTEDGQVAVAAIEADEGSPVVATPSESPEPVVDNGSSGGEASQGEASVTAEAPVEETETATPTEPLPTPTEPPPTPTQLPPTPTETPPAPTMTPSPIEISVDATDTPETSATPPVEQAEGDITSEEPASSPTEAVEAPAQAPPQQSPAVQPTETPVPIQAPFSQPTIAPISGQSDTAQGSNAGDSPTIVPNDGSDVEAASASESNGNDSPPIVSSDSTAESGGVGSAGSSDNVGQDGMGGDNGQSSQGQNDEPSPIPTADESAAPSGLDLSDTVAELPSGASSPLGRLEFSPGMDLYAVVAPDGQLAVANLDGELVVTLGQGDLPVWSGNALMFSAPGDNGSVVGIWDSNSGDLSYIPAAEDEASSDLPIGGDGTSFYYLRTFPDRSGAMEIRSASIDGSDNGSLWSSDSTALGGARPAWTSNGILLPTDSSWLLIDFDGNETELGNNPYGSVGVPVLSPGEGLMAYSVGDQVVVAWSDDPGAAVATVPFGSGSGGYAFSTSGEEVVVSDGSSLQVVSYEGSDLGTLSGNQPLGGVYWINDTIYYLQIGQDAALKSTNLDTIQSN